MTTSTSTSTGAWVGVSDHAGWAVLVTVGPERTVLDRRRIELVEPGIPCMPHHHEGQKLPIEEAVALVRDVESSAERAVATALDRLEGSLAVPIAGIALRRLQTLPGTVAERITDYRAMCVADWVMYRRIMAEAAATRGWQVHWYDPQKVLAQAAEALAPASLEALLRRAGATLGPPWQKDHKLAMAAALLAGEA